MNRNLILAGLAGIIILGGIIFMASRDKNSSELNVETVQKKENRPDESMIFFYGKGCPHCENVEKFLEENKNIEEKVKFEKLEVWENRENRDLMVEKAKNCGMDTSKLGVPLFWDGKNCLVGDVPIIDFLKQKASE